MKKAIALMLCIITVFALVSCNENTYPPIESTEEEARVVMTISYEGKKYEVKYELYRALFLNFKSQVDGGMEHVWGSEDCKDGYIAQINELIKDYVSEIYAVFHICDKIGINIYSDKYDKLVDNYIVASVEGGYVGSTEVSGFGGDYNKYLESLKAMNLNYSVQTLLLRYSMAVDEINNYYGGMVDYDGLNEVMKPGKLEYTDKDIEEFYNSSECVRVLRAYLPTDYFTRERASEIRNTMEEKSGETAVGNYIISMSLGASDIKNGMIIAKHNLNPQYYGEMVKAAFALGPFDTSEVIEVFTGIESAYVILYRAAKSNEYFETCKQDIVDAYVANEIGKIINETQEAMRSKMTFTDVEIDHALISMD